MVRLCGIGHTGVDILTIRHFEIRYSGNDPFREHYVQLVFSVLAVQRPSDYVATGVCIHQRLYQTI